MRVKVVGDGTPFGTRVVDADTGEAVEHVTAVDLRLTPDGIDARLTLLHVEVDVLAEVEYVGEYRRPMRTRSDDEGGDR